MKKIIIVLILLTIAFLISNGKSTEVLIPKEAIRFRVIANSNTKIDQMNKRKITSNLEQDLSNLLKDSNSLVQTRMTLKNNIGNFQTNIEQTLKENNMHEDYTIDYGNH